MSSNLLDLLKRIHLSTFHTGGATFMRDDLRFHILPTGQVDIYLQDKPEHFSIFLENIHFLSELPMSREDLTAAQKMILGRSKTRTKQKGYLLSRIDNTSFLITSQGDFLGVSDSGEVYYGKYKAPRMDLDIVEVGSKLHKELWPQPHE